MERARFDCNGIATETFTGSIQQFAWV